MIIHSKQKLLFTTYTLQHIYRTQSNRIHLFLPTNYIMQVDSLIRTINNSSEKKKEFPFDVEMVNKHTKVKCWTLLRCKPLKYTIKNHRCKHKHKLRNCGKKKKRNTTTNVVECSWHQPYSHRFPQPCFDPLPYLFRSCMCLFVCLLDSCMKITCHHLLTRRCKIMHLMAINWLADFISFTNDIASS